MIIQCERCSTKFRLDDSRVTEKGVKVRCAKCRHVFSVSKAPPEPDMQADLDAMLDEPNPDFGAMFDERLSSPPLQEQQPPQDLMQIDTPLAESSIPADDYSDFVSNDFSGKENLTDLIPVPPQQEESLPAFSTGDDSVALFSPDEEQGLALKHKETQEELAMVSPYDLDDVDLEPLAVPMSGEGLELRDTLEFEEIPIGSYPDDSPDLSGQYIEKTDAAPEVAAFADDEVPYPVSPEDGKFASFAGTLVAPETETEVARHDKAISGEMPRTTQDEPPPLTIASRRKPNYLLGFMIAVATLVVVAVLGFFGYTLFMEDKLKVTPETGKIKIGAVNASFVVNPSAGELLVITGEAINGFSRPRAAIQVKGMVYASNGEELASKNAYCGNPLTKEQLSTLSLDKIESAMANQFGDSLANMEVPPGKGIPFMIVIAKPPVAGKEYGVEAVGSTVAAGKQ